jgi:magnesium-transporting ATPase (P-type)
MVFKSFSINDSVYEQVDGTGLCKVNTKRKLKITDDKMMVRFFEAMSLCHTVQVDEQTVEKFHASSPDELSFIKFCES